MTVYLLQPFNALRIDAYLMRTGFVQTMQILPIRNASAGLLDIRLFARISTRLLARLSLKDKDIYYGSIQHALVTQSGMVCPIDGRIA